MLGDTFMWDPDQVIKGETSDSFFSRCKAFEVLEWVFKVDNGTTANYEDEKEGEDDKKKPKSSTYNPRTGIMPGKLKFNEIQITKVVDSASTLLYKACCTEEDIPSLIMVSRKAGGDALNYLQYIFRQVHVTSIQWEGGSGTERAKETLTLDFKALGMQYIQQTAEGRATGALDWRWNRVKETNTLNIDDGSPAPPFIAAYAPNPSKK
jgi:type VI secretion system secreted protein Hcp